MLVALGRINALNAAIHKHLQKSRSAEALRQELLLAERQYDSLMGELDEKYHQFVATETAQAITSRQVAESPALDDQTAIIGWVVFRHLTWGYVIRRDSVRWVDLSKDFKPAAQRKLLRRIVSAGSSLGPIARVFALSQRKRTLTWR